MEIKEPKTKDAKRTRTRKTRQKNKERQAGEAGSQSKTMTDKDIHDMLHRQKLRGKATTMADKDMHHVMKRQKKENIEKKKRDDRARSVTASGRYKFSAPFICFRISFFPTGSIVLLS